jgi:hypothetical protein
MFFFFNNRMGCAVSLILTIVGTVLLMALLGWW